MRSRLLAASAALVAAAALALAPALSAAAHDYLVDSDPQAGSTVTTALHQVSLTFNDHVYGGPSSLVTVTGPDAGTRHYETGCATTTDRVVTAPVALGAPGRYTITYQIVSADGHTVSNALSFTYQPPSGATAAAGSASAVCGGGTTSAAPVPHATPGANAGGPGVAATQSAGTPAPLTTSSSVDPALVIGIAIGIAALAVVGVLIVVLAARRRPAAPTAPADGPPHPPAPPLE
jgi:hypothetical protein